MLDIVMSSTNMEFIQIPASQAEISTYPVLTSDYYQNGSTLDSTKAGATPITDVSASEAYSFAEGRGARLPEYEEIIEFLNMLKRDEKFFQYPSPSIEWLNCSPAWNKENLKMNCIASIDTALKRLIFKGSIQNRRYPFVTFRIARPR